MRIAIVVKTFPPDVIGGMETQTRQMATELHESGHNVTVFTKQFTAHDDSDVAYEMARIRNWQVTPFISDLTFLIFALIELFRRSEEFDCVQCMMLYPVGFLGYVLNRVSNLPYFAWIRGGDYYLMNDIWWKRWMMRRVLADTKVLAQSEEIRDDVVADFDDVDCQIEILGNAVSVPESPSQSGDSILYVGRLAPKKGVEYLLKAMSIVSTEHPLVIVGDGSQRDALEKQAESLGLSNVSFVGAVLPDEVDSFYRDARVLVLPSLEGEGMPNVILEAMAWGVPVVATDSGGIPSLIVEGETGYLVSQGDPEVLAMRIEKTLYDNRYQEMGKNAHHYVKNQHSWEAQVASLERIYDEVVRRKPR